MTGHSWMGQRGQTVGRRIGWMVALVVAMSLVGCVPEIEQDPVPDQRVSTIFDSQTGVIPLPNNAALQESGTLPPQPGAGEDTAQGDFLSYLTTIHGWLRVAPIEVPFDGELDPSTVTTDSVRLYRFPDGADASQAERLDVAEVTVESSTFQVADEDADQQGATRTVDGSMLTIVPAEPLQRDTRYGYVVTDAVKSTDGRDTVASQAIFFAASNDPLVDDDGESTVESLSDSQARQLDGLRQLMQPIFQVAASNDLDRKSIVAASVWTTFEDTMVEFDPSAGSIPFPNDFVRQGSGGTVTIPVPDDASPLQQQLLGELRTRTGFSTVAPGWIDFAGPIETDTLTEESFLAMSLYTDTTGLYEPDRFGTRFLEESNHLIFEPTVPLRPGVSLGTRENEAQNIWAMTTDVEGDNGYSIKPSPVFVLLRSAHPLVDSEGNSTVSILSDGQAQQLEPARQRYNQFLNAATQAPQLIGLPADFELTREELAVAFFAHPSNPTQDARTVRARGLAEVGDAPAATFASGSNCTGGGGGDCELSPGDLDNIQIAQHAGEFETVQFLQSDGTLDTSSPSRQSVGISVFVPEQTGDCSGVSQFPVAIVQHGLSGWREGMSGVAEALAAECVATVAMDFVGHGGRTPGAGSLHPDSRPADSGQTFITTDLVRTKNNFLQSFVDLSVLAEYIASDGLESAIDDAGGTEYFAYDDGMDTKVGYAGQSLGGIVGTSFTTIDDETTVGAYNVAGGKLSRILSEGALGGDIIQALRDAGIEEGSFQEVQVLSFIQWIAEPIDPVAFAPFLVESPVDELEVNMDGDIVRGDDLPVNEPLVQMAAGDAIVPNGATEAMVRAIGGSVSLSDTTFQASHGFLTSSDPGAGTPADCARRQIAAWLSSGLGVGGSTEATLPSELTAGNCVSQ